MSNWIDKDAFKKYMYHESFEVDNGMQKWDSGLWIRYKLFEQALRNADTIEAEPMKHGYWDNNHCCSVCHKEAFSNLTKIEEIYDYDWDENLVPTGSFEEYYDWFETDYCPNCGAKMDLEEVKND